MNQCRNHLAIAVLIIGLTPLISNCQINTQQRSTKSTIKHSRLSSQSPKSVVIPPPIPLIAAVKQGDVVKVQTLLNEGNDVQGIIGSRALALAVITKNTEIVQKLLRHGADPNVSTEILDSDTAVKPNTEGKVEGILLLREAIRKNQVDMVNLLLDAGANPNLQDTNSDSILQEALLNNTYIKFLNPADETVQAENFPIIGQEKVQIILAMIAKGVTAEQRDHNGRTVLMLAAGQGQTEIVKQLLSKGAKVNAVNAYGATPLMYAAVRGKLETVKVLVEQGANINDTMTTYKYILKPSFKSIKVPKTVLTYAQESGSQDVVNYLVQRGATTSLLSE